MKEELAKMEKECEEKIEKYEDEKIRILEQMEEDEEIKIERERD